MYCFFQKVIICQTKIRKKSIDNTSCGNLSMVLCSLHVYLSGSIQPKPHPKLCSKNLSDISWTGLIDW